MAKPAKTRSKTGRNYTGENPKAPPKIKSKSNPSGKMSLADRIRARKDIALQYKKGGRVGFKKKK